MLKFYEDEQEARELLKQADVKLNGISGLKEGYNIVIAADERKEIYFVPKQVYDVYKRIKPYKNPYTFGFFFGEYKTQIILSLESLYKFAKKSEFHKAIISEPAETPFLFGKDLIAAAIKKYDTSIRKGDLVVVCDQYNEALGIGEAVLDFSGHLSGKRIAIRNVMDRGWYLRHKE